MKKQHFILFVLLPSTTWADLPLTVEDLTSEEGKTKFELSATYSNTENRGVDVRESITVQTGPTSFVNIPTAFGEKSSNSDVLITTAGLRHGLNPKTEVYGRTSVVGFSERGVSSSGEIRQDSGVQFADAWVGLNRQINGDTDKPGLLGFAELQVAERQSDGKVAYGKSAVLGGTLYQTYDPVVLSMTGAVQLNAGRDVDGVRKQLGHSLTLSPSVGFAVNDRVTLSGGVNWRVTQADKENGKRIDVVKTDTSLDLGATYAINEGDLLDFKVRPKISGDGGVQMTMGWTKSFAADVPVNQDGTSRIRLER